MNILVLLCLSLTVLLSSPAMGRDLLPVKTLEAVPKAVSTGTLTEKANLVSTLVKIINDFVSNIQNDVMEAINEISKIDIGNTSVVQIVAAVIEEFESLIKKLRNNFTDLIADILEALRPSKTMLIESLKKDLLSINQTAAENVEKAELLMKCLDQTLIADKKP